LSTSRAWCAAPRRARASATSFLATIREVDAVAHVVRCFEDPTSPMSRARSRRWRIIETIETELMLAISTASRKRVDNLTKKRQKATTRTPKEQLDLVNRALVLLREGKPARFLQRKPEEERAFGMLDC